MNTLFNFIGFQISWFASVLGGAHRMPWLGTVVVCLWLFMHVYMTHDRLTEVSLAVTAGALGFLLDGLVIACGEFYPRHCALL